MWLWYALGSALLLGIYDTFKKKASYSNGVMNVLLYATLISTVCFIPFLLSSLFGWGLGAGTVFDAGQGTVRDHLWVIVKSVVVALSWISGLYGLKNLPMTTAGTIKASRPVFVLLFSILIFSERLNPLQWAGVAVSMLALWMLSVSSRREGIYFARNKWVLLMFVSIIAGVVSALIDKHIMSWMQPLFVQSWCNFYVVVIMAAIVVFQKLSKSEWYEKFHWDWAIFFIAMFLTLADYLYFLSLSCEGSMLSIISLLRRSSVIVSFISGAILFKEGNLKAKAFDLLILLAGMTILVFASR